MKTINQLREAIKNSPARSAWNKGVKLYALELIEEMPDTREFYASPADKKELLNGADNWQQYSEGGNALIYDGDIAERLCNPSEYKRTKEGERQPNARESWIDVQARALYQAYRLICRLAKE
jgi:hypothetical protein